MQRDARQAVIGCAGLRKVGGIPISDQYNTNTIVECGPMPNVMDALPNIGGALYSTPHSLADAKYWSVVQ